MRTHTMRSTSRISPLFCVVCVGAGSCRRPGARLRRVRVRRHAGPTTGAHAPCILKEKMCSAHGVFFSRRKRSTTFVRCVPVSAPYLGPYRIARRRTVSLRIGICGYRPATSTARAVGALRLAFASAARPDRCRPHIRAAALRTATHDRTVRGLVSRASRRGSVCLLLIELRRLTGTRSHASRGSLRHQCERRDCNRAFHGERLGGQSSSADE